MVSWKKNLILGVSWGAVALFLLLFPSPRGWGPFGWRINHFYDEYREILQPTVHFFLMVACALLIMHFFARRSAGVAAVYALAIALGLAISLELFQALLPERFARVCDPNDLVPSLVGAVGGIIIGVLMRLCLAKRDDGQ